MFVNVIIPDSNHYLKDKREILEIKTLDDLLQAIPKLQEKYGGKYLDFVLYPPSMNTKRWSLIGMWCDIIEKNIFDAVATPINAFKPYKRDD